MNEADIVQGGFREGERIDLIGSAFDGVERVFWRVQTLGHGPSAGCFGGDDRACNPLRHGAEGNNVPAVMSVTAGARP